MTLVTQSTSGSAVAVAFPQITSSFDTSVALAGWVLSIFSLAQLIVVPISGKASDALGRKRTFMVFVFLFTVGSLLCAVSPSIYWLILARLIQGAGAGGFITSATGILSDTFPESRQRYIGFMVSIFSVGMVLGPNVGGWLTQSFGWKYCFWFAVPLGVAIMVAGAFLLKPDGKMKKIRVDLRGAVIFAASIAAIMVGLTSIKGGNSGAFWGVAALLLIAGVILAAVFLRHEGRVEDPMIEIEVLRGKPFAAANIFNVVFGINMGILTFLPLYAVTVYGASTVESGLIVTPRAIALMIGSVFSSILLVRWGYRRPMIAGTIAISAALLLLGLVANTGYASGAVFGGIGLLVIGVSLSGIGHGFLSPAANNACIELMPDRVSTITGVRNAGRNLGVALGITITSVALDSLGSLNRGFEFVFIGGAVMSLLSIPCILAMPRSPSDVTPYATGQRAAVVTPDAH